MPANVKKVNEQVLRNIVLNTLNNKLENKKKLGKQLINVILSNKDSDEAKLKKAKYLLRLGADVHQKDEYGSTALIWASSQGYKDVVEMLLDKGADINQKDNYGYTALLKASDKETKKVIKEHIKKTGGEPTNGGFLGKIFDGFGR